jgi:hypothetical protein
MRSFCAVARRLLASSSVLLFLFAGRCFQSETPCSPTDPTCGGTSQPAVTSRLLSVPYIPQQTQVWCWAATSEMIFRYYGINASQCQLVSVYVGRACCVSDPFCLVAASSMPTIAQGLGIVGGIRASYVPRPLTFDEVAAEITAGRPVMVGYHGSFSGHVVLITGFDRRTSIVHILDPYFGVFDVPFGVTYTYAGQDVWADTLVGISR